MSQQAGIGGGWNRLHPATPFLRGGIVVLAIAGILIANTRDAIINAFIAGDAAAEPGNAQYDAPGWAQPFFDLAKVFGIWVVGAVAVAILVVVVVGLSYLSWRRHSYRVTAESVEVRSGIVFRTSRQARLDRVQGVNINRSVLARIFGASQLKISTAGQDRSQLDLSYLRNSVAEKLRLEILALAGAPGKSAQASEADPPRLVEPASVVRIPPIRLVMSRIIGFGTLGFVAVVAAATFALMSVDNSGRALLLAAVPFTIAVGGILVSRVLRLLRFSIAPTGDGVRIGQGLLSTVNDTIPTGRIHAVEVLQPLLWRPFGWWTILINKAGDSGVSGGDQSVTTVLPVGKRDDVVRVLAVILPDIPLEDALIDFTLTGTGTGHGFVGAPKRSWFALGLSRNRHSYRLGQDEIMMRGGFLWRTMVVVPLARVQNVSITQGWLARQTRLAAITTQTVRGLVRTRFSSLDSAHAHEAFAVISDAVIVAGLRDEQAR